VQFCEQLGMHDALRQAEDESGVEDQAPLTIPPGTVTVFGHDELRDVLGKGGCGVVYRAWNPKQDRFEELKMIPRDRMGADEAARRFLWKARTASNLAHPHIVPVYHVDELEGLLY